MYPNSPLLMAWNGESCDSNLEAKSRMMPATLLCLSNAIVSVLPSGKDWETVSCCILMEAIGLQQM